jgi:long-chain acyl-CoA synthetase
MEPSAIVAAVRETAAKVPAKIALIAGEQQLTYAELIRQAQSAGAHMAQQADGDNVGIFLPNSLDFALYFLGALWAGKTVAVLPTLAPAPLLKFMFAQARLTTIFTSADLAPKLAEAGVLYAVLDATYPTVSDFAPQPRSHDAAVLLYTSGTTGRPKTVALSESNITSNVKECCEATGFDDRQVMLAILPLFHAYGLTVTILLPLIMGSTVVIAERFVPRTVLTTIERHRVTTVVAVPSQYRVLAMDPTPCDATSSGSASPEPSACPTPPSASSRAALGIPCCRDMAPPRSPRWFRSTFPRPTVQPVSANRCPEQL